MRNYFLILILFTSIFFQSCEDLLKEEIYGKITNESFWQTEEDAEAAILAAYGQTRGGWRGLSLWQFVLEDLGTDIGMGGYSSTLSYSNYTDWTKTNPDFTDWGIWAPFWKCINYTNTVLDNVPQMDINSSVKDRVTGEAYALRAMVYFHLTNWFGGVPEVTTTVYDKIPVEIQRGTIESNYEMMVKDLTKAVDLLPLKSELIDMGELNYARLTKHAAQALLAKVYLQQGEWQLCANAASEILQSGEYSLENSYMDIFSLSNEGYDNSEIIWVMPFVTGTSPVVDANVLQVYLWKASENSDYDNYYDWGGDIRATLDFYNSFESGDSRREGLFRSSDGTANPVMMIKYPADPDTDGKFSGTDYPFIRLADVILMSAESLAQLNDLRGAVTEINKIRDRADLAAIDTIGQNQESILDHVLLERKWELYFEGHTKRDIIRMDPDAMIEYITARSGDADNPDFNAENYFILPIPSGALTSNPGLTQNEGFN